MAAYLPPHFTVIFGLQSAGIDLIYTRSGGCKSYHNAGYYINIVSLICQPTLQIRLKLATSGTFAGFLKSLVFSLLLCMLFPDQQMIRFCSQVVH